MVGSQSDIPKYEWGADTAFFGPRHKYREDLILKELTSAIPPGSRVLDVASGLGSLSMKLLERGYIAYAADLSERSLAWYRSSCHRLGLSHRGLSAVADIRLLPFPSGFFDAVVSAETLEHIPDHEVAVKELARVLKFGGICVITVPANPHLWTSKDDIAEHKRRYVKEELESLFKEDEFQILKTHYWGFPFTRLYDTLLLSSLFTKRAKGEKGVVLRLFASLGQSKLLVTTFTAILKFDNLFNATPWGIGLLLVARRASQPRRCIFGDNGV